MNITIVQAVSIVFILGYCMWSLHQLYRIGEFTHMLKDQIFVNNERIVKAEDRINDLEIEMEAHDDYHNSL